MITKIYVGNLSFKVADTDLKEMFTEAGTVKSVSIVRKPVKELGRRRTRIFGFDESKKLGVIHMASKKEARSAIKLFHGKQLHGRSLIVKLGGPHGTGDRP